MHFCKIWVDWERGTLLSPVDMESYCIQRASREFTTLYHRPWSLCPFIHIHAINCHTVCHPILCVQARTAPPLPRLIVLWKSWVRTVVEGKERDGCSLGRSFDLFEAGQLRNSALLVQSGRVLLLTIVAQLNLECIGKGNQACCRRTSAWYSEEPVTTACWALSAIFFFSKSRSVVSKLNWSAM